MHLNWQVSGSGILCMLAWCKIIPKVGAPRDPSPIGDPTPRAPKKSSAAPACTCPVSAAKLRHHSQHAYPGAPQGRHHPLMHRLPPGLGSPRSLSTAKLTWWDKALGYPGN